MKTLMKGRPPYLVPTVLAAVTLAMLIGFVSIDGGSQAPASPATSGSWLEFDAPPGDATKITGFVVGYFIPGEKTPAAAFEVARTQIESPRAGVLRIPLIVSKLPGGREYQIRLRTIVGGRRSNWSAPSGTFTVPDDGGTTTVLAAATDDEPKRSASRTARRGAPARSAVSELEKNPDVAARLGKQFPGVTLAEAAVGFTTARDLGAALFAAENLKIPFKEVKRLTADAGNRDLRKAIAELKPGVNANAEAQRALKQSRQALRAPRKGR